MEIAPLSTSLAMTNLNDQVSTQVMAMSLDNLEAMGDGMKKIMEASVNPGVGGNFDVSV